MTDVLTQKSHLFLKIVLFIVTCFQLYKVVALEQTDKQTQTHTHTHAANENIKNNNCIPTT